MAVIKDHQNDVKEFNTDTKSFIEIPQFTEQIKELIYASDYDKSEALRLERAANRKKSFMEDY
jgi:hypothetical protein